MKQAAESLLSRIDARLEAMGKTRYWLSMQVSDRKQHGIIRDIERRGTMPGGARLARIAEELDTTTDWLLGKVDNPAPVLSEVSIRETGQAFVHQQGERIPVLGTAYCDDLIVESGEGETVEVERVMIETDHVIRMIERPPALWNARDAYAIYFHGASMEPRFYQSELAIVDPRRPPAPNDFVVVQLNDGGSDDVMTVIVKQYLRTAGGFVELRQFNPPRDFRIPRDQVTRMHRICSNNELYGG